MESASKVSKHSSQWVEKPVEEVFVPKPKITLCKIRSRVDAKIKVTGKYSGQAYLFDGAGAVQDVDNRDVEWLLEKRQGKACCGGTGGTPIFELTGEQ